MSLNIELKIFPSDSLRKKALPLSDFSQVREIGELMLEVMYLNNGVGLAANQVGLLSRIFVMDCSDERKEPVVLINPEIIEHGPQKHTIEEGCLSLPGISHKVTRPSTVFLRYITMDEKIVEQEFSGLSSSCVQHEIDHLDGILFPDRVSLFKQPALWKKYHSLKKA